MIYWLPILLLDAVNQAPRDQVQAAPASGEASGLPVVSVISPPEMDASMAEALNRFRGEAAAVGFTVVIVAGSGGTTPLTEMESASRAVSAVASVAFVSTGDPLGVDVWFTDRVHGRTAVDHVSVASDLQDRPLILAVKAVDALRAQMFDFIAGAGKPLAAGSHGRTTGSSGLTSVGAGRSPNATAVWIAAGLGATHSFQGLGTTFVPLLRGELGVADRWSLRVTFGALGTERVVTVPGARASVSQSFGIFDCALTPGRRRLRPVVALGAGAYYIRADGAATPPYTAHTASRLFAAAEFSLGVRAFVSRSISATIEAGPVLIVPQPQVSLLGLDPQRTGRPALVAAVMIEARL